MAAPRRTDTPLLTRAERHSQHVKCVARPSLSEPLVIQAANTKPDPIIFVLWGAYAQKKGKHIDEKKHRVLKSGHPSPLSMHKFFGTKPFSKINAALREVGKEEIDWQIPDV